MINRTKMLITALLRNPKGNATVELALSIPILTALLLGGVEVTRYILITQKLEKVAVTLSDVATQSESISIGELDEIIFAAGQVMQPYPFGSNAYVVISSVTKTAGNPPIVNWQYRGGGTWAQASRIGVQGSSANMPAGFDMDNQENVIVSEVFYDFEPLVNAFVLPQHITIYKTGFFRPRLGSLTTLSALQPAHVLQDQRIALRGAAQGGLL